jgi:hypothetical protein
MSFWFANAVVANPIPMANATIPSTIVFLIFTALSFA